MGYFLVIAMMIVTQSRTIDMSANQAVELCTPTKKKKMPKKMKIDSNKHNSEKSLQSRLNFIFILRFTETAVNKLNVNRAENKSAQNGNTKSTNAVGQASSRRRWSS